MTTIQKADGTVLTQTVFNSTYRSGATVTVYTATEDLYRTEWVPGGALDHTTRKLWKRAGEVMTDAEMADAFKEPTITGISPTGGTTAGSTVITITGTNLYDTTGITVGGSAATALTKVDNEHIKCTTPAHAGGAVDVVLTTPAGAVTSTGGYTYS